MKGLAQISTLQAIPTVPGASALLQLWLAFPPPVLPVVLLGHKARSAGRLENSRLVEGPPGVTPDLHSLLSGCLKWPGLCLTVTRDQCRGVFQERLSCVCSLRRRLSRASSPEGQQTFEWTERSRRGSPFPAGLWLRGSEWQGFHRAPPSPTEGRLQQPLPSSP